AFLALSVFHRHRGLIDSDLGPRLLDLVDLATYARARIVGAAIRVANVLSASMAGVIPDTPVMREGDRLVLHLPGSLAVLDGERLDRRFAALAKELELTPEIRTGKKRAKKRERQPA
ncbi:MAG: exopolyphosphatase, partial [Hyphomicrobiales bacterium]|nr:exopolyphosphatase [Hyphomicrobiales bacterium]